MKKKTVENIVGEVARYFGIYYSAILVNELPPAGDFGMVKRWSWALANAVKAYSGIVVAGDLESEANDEDPVVLVRRQVATDLFK